jgi:hypothetical protein
MARPRTNPELDVSDQTVFDRAMADECRACGEPLDYDWHPRRRFCTNLCRQRFYTACRRASMPHVETPDRP